MAVRTCLNCVYVDCDLCEWVSCHQRGESLVPRCANHPQWPGELHDVPGTPCRNYQPKPPEPKGNVRRIPVGDGQFAIVDAADYEWLNRHHWRLLNGYVARREKGRTIYMHREIMQPPKGMMVDHADRNKLHNYRLNLRVCTRRENNLNQGKRRNSSSRFKGVKYDKRWRKWGARIRFHGEPVWIGCFDSDIEAARAYDRKAVEFFGAFAYLNFPEEWPPERRQEVYAAAQPLRDTLTTKAAQAKAEKGKGKRTKVRAGTRGRRERTRPTKGRRSEGK